MCLWEHVYRGSHDDLPAWRLSYSAELLDMVCHDVQIEPVLQPITGEELANGTNQAPDARLDIPCRGF